MRLSLSVLLCLSWIASSPAAEPVPLEVFGALPNLEQVALSPDGAHVAMVTTRGEERLLVVGSMVDAKGTGAIKLGQNKIREVLWADQDTVLLTVSTTAMPMGLAGFRTEFFQLWQVCPT